MTKKPLLLCAVFLLLSSAVWAGEETAFEPALPQNPLEKNLLPLQPMLDCTSGYDLGDVNFSGKVEFDDLIFLVNCVFVHPTSPDCLWCVADINCDTFYSPVDLVILFRFYYGIYSEYPLVKLRCPN